MIDLFAAFRRTVELCLTLKASPEVAPAQSRRAAVSKIRKTSLT
jgi:hypothetical protein